MRHDPEVLGYRTNGAPDRVVAEAMDYVARHGLPSQGHSCVNSNPPAIRGPFQEVSGDSAGMGCTLLS